jgi:hypothetical protein
MVVWPTWTPASLCVCVSQVNRSSWYIILIFDSTRNFSFGNDPLVRSSGINGGRVNKKEHCTRWERMISDIRPHHLVFHAGGLKWTPSKYMLDIQFFIFRRFQYIIVEWDFNSRFKCWLNWHTIKLYLSTGTLYVDLRSDFGYPSTSFSFPCWWKRFRSKQLQGLYWGNGVPAFVHTIIMERQIQHSDYYCLTANRS